MRSPLLRRLAAVIGVLAVLVLGATPARAADKAKLLGGGSSFSALLVDQWRADTRSKPFSLDVNYQGTGSSQGRQAFWQRTVDFAVSDIPYEPGEVGANQVPAAGSFRYITAVAGALGMMYNLVDDSGNRVEDLRLDPRTLCRIFTEPLTKVIYWNDPEIQALNQTLLPNKQILPVVRSDGSGTSYVLAQYCIATAPDVWEAFRTAALANPGTRSQAMQDRLPVSNWPVGGAGFTPAAQSTGIANAVSGLANSITYIEAGYAEITGLPLASVRNAAGRFVAPTPQGITTALKYATVQSDGTFKLAFDAQDPAAYFPSTYSYMLVPLRDFDAGKGRTLSEYIYYAMTVGQDQCEPLAYARLSQNLIDDAIAAAATIPGATPFETWKQTVGLTTTGGDGGGGGGSGGGGGGGTTDTTVSGSGSGGGGSTGGGSTGGGSTGGGSTGGGSTGGGSTGGGSTGGGSTGDGSTDDAAAPGGATGGGTVTTVAGAAAGGGTKAGGTTATTRAGGGTKSGAGAGGGTNAGGGTVASGSTGNTAQTASRKPPGPSNAEVVWVMLQGAAILGAGLLLHRTVGMATR